MILLNKMLDIILMLFVVIFVILIIYGLVLGVSSASELKEYLKDSKEFCETNGGEWRYNGCLIEENGELINYNIIKFKGEMRLIE